MEQSALISQNQIGEEEILTDPQITSPTHPLVTESLLQSNEILKCPSENIEILNPDIPISLETDNVSTRKSFLEKELKNLQSYNGAGVSELHIPNYTSRKRVPTYNKAKYIYNEALESLRTEIQEFNAQKFQTMEAIDLTNTDVSSRCKRIVHRESALLMAFEDLSSLTERQGLYQENKSLKEQVDKLLTQTTFIKLTFKDFISNCSTILRDDLDRLDHSKNDNEVQVSIPNLVPTFNLGMGLPRLTPQVPILSASDTERPKVPLPAASNSHSSPKVCFDTQPHTMNSITRGIPSILPLASSNIPHTHTVVCYSPTCITDQFITGSCNNTYPTNLPIYTSAKPRYSEEKSFHDLSEETNKLSPTYETHQSLDHFKTAAREHKALILEEPDLQGSSRKLLKF